jgi:UDP-N-acetylglucosamine 2-epimerase (non-hydrolysing)
LSIAPGANKADPEGPRVSVVAAARPNFMKVGPVVAALTGRVNVELVHTGQHYDDRMSSDFFHDLGIPEPDVNLGVGSGSHAEQTAGVLVAYEQHLLKNPADAVVVVGDVNSTLAAALAAAKLHIPIAHVEAGLRSGDWSMPEEINRVLTDRLSRWLFTPSADADENLKAEGIDSSRIHLVGNVMIDSLLAVLPTARSRFERLAQRLGLTAGHFGVLTLHRPGNVDTAEQLHAILEGIARIEKDLPVLFPVHPRTRGQLDRLGLEFDERIRFLEPLGYVDFLSLLDQAALVFTDSGGIQEETSVLGVPCLTLRPNTERPITCQLGTNRVVGTDPLVIAEAAEFARSRQWEPAAIPLWDGKAAERIVKTLLEDLG